MKIRSLILFSCMAFVPLVAMFSHKIPREWRQAAQRLARGEGLPAWRVTPAVAAAPPAPAGAEEPIKRVEHDDRDKPAMVAVPSPARPSPSVKEQLQALGAVAIECVPVAGGMHRCSCRVPAEPSGQLQRVFQTSNPDSDVALKNLLGQVQFWKNRLALRPQTDHPQPADTGVGPTRRY